MHVASSHTVVTHGLSAGGNADTNAAISSTATKPLIAV